METMNPPPWVPIPGYSTGYPNPSRKLGKAWAYVWGELSQATDWVDGVDLAARSVEAVGLQPVTMISLMTRAAAAGVLDRKLIKVEGLDRGARMRTHYKVPARG